MAEPTTPSAETFHFQADVDQLLRIVVHSLYSHKEIFLRELISNASDALDKLKFRALTEHELMGEQKDLEIRIVFDKDAKTITIEDTGVGMTREELHKNLGTIAHSGTRAFLQKAKEKGAASNVNLIGEFGVGFYSSYLVADTVEVTSRAAGATEAWKWTSDAKGSFTIEPAERAERGTLVKLHVRDDQKEFLDEWRLRDLVKRYSDYVSYPIKAKAKEEWETINKGSALWQRPKSELKPENYEEFYKHTTHDWEKPLAWTHFKVEGTTEFAGILFVPSHPPFDLFDRSARRGVRLYVKRVFIMDDCEALIPEYLRFLRGVIDSDDLPLNVSREMLQKETVVQIIKKNVTRKALDTLEEMAKEKPEDFTKFWKQYGAVLKEGLHFDRENRDRIARLCRFHTTAGDALVSLPEYVLRMKPGQEGIYYVIAETLKAATGSPHIETLKKKGFEVLLLADPVDEWAVEALQEFEGKKLIDAMKAGADLGKGETDDEKKAREEKAEKLKGLLETFQDALKERVNEVKVSQRLTDSPVCLVIPDGGLHAYMERLLKAHDREVPAQKRILEVNPAHPLIERLDALRLTSGAKVREWIELLYDQALLAEGSPVDDPAAFAKRLTALLTEVAQGAA